MSEYELRRLLAEVGRVLGLDDPHRLADLRQAVVDDMHLRLLFHPATDPRRLVLHYALGELPEAASGPVLARLMRLNLISGSKTTGVFALAPTGGQLIYSVHCFDVHHHPPEALAAAMREHAAKAREVQPLLLAPEGSAALTPAIRA